jgi:hypothetical protein
MRRIVIALALLVIPAQASAQPEAPRQQPPVSDDCARAKRAGKPCKIVFDTAEEIDGKRLTSGVDTITGRSSLTFSSLISIRESFRDQIIYSAEDL